MRVWRICNRKYASSAWNGEGSYVVSGRWNPAGVRMVYTSTSLSLAAVELFVHLSKNSRLEAFASSSATVPEDASMERIELATLPADWRETGRTDLQQIGADWIRRRRAVALYVPSVAIQGEWNVLLNPLHPDFTHVKIDAPQPFVFDARMFK